MSGYCFVRVRSDEIDWASLRAVAAAVGIRRAARPEGPADVSLSGRLKRNLVVVVNLFPRSQESDARLRSPSAQR